MGEHTERVPTTDLVTLMVIQGSVGGAISAAKGGLIGSTTIVEGLMHALTEGHEQGTQELLARGYEQEFSMEVLRRHDQTLPAMLR